ncbi:MAG: 30S ribosomal protein S19e [Candidatus Micrarchaeota archaeon]
MVTVYDVDALKLIKKTAQKLEEMNLEMPAWVGNVKSGAHAERLPQDDKFWYIRCASILRKAYLNPRIGVSRLRTHYGGRKDRGVKPEKHRRAGGSTIRKGMQALEKAELLKKGKVGRELAPKGRKLLDAAAKLVADEADGKKEE